MRLTPRDRVVMSMADALGGDDRFFQAEELARTIEEVNRTPLAEIYAGSLETDRQCGVDAPPDLSTPEAFGASLVEMVKQSGPGWFAHHHDFDLVIP